MFPNYSWAGLMIVGALSAFSFIGWIDFYEQYTEAEEDLREAEKYRNGYKNILDNIVEDQEMVTFKDIESRARFSWKEEVEMEVEN